VVLFWKLEILHYNYNGGLNGKRKRVLRTEKEKEMKLYKVMELLEENPTDVYEAELTSIGWTVRMSVIDEYGGYYHFDVFNGKRLVDQSLDGGAFNNNVALNLDWQLVKQPVPVPWQEAIEAWVDGKKVVWEEDMDRRVFDRNKSWPIPKYQNRLLDQDGYAVTVRMISGGKWYVED
jgi:hypothetical protein